VRWSEVQTVRGAGGGSVGYSRSTTKEAHTQHQFKAVMTESHLKRRLKVVLEEAKP
jgi:hypothetical protein